MKYSFSIGCIATLLIASITAWAAEFHVDPNTGSMQNDGSAAHPWRTLQEVIEANLIETQCWESTPPKDDTKLVPKNAGAPVKAGDTVWLHDGYHGDISIQCAFNAKPITIAAAKGETPKIRSLHLQSGSDWVFRGLTVSPEFVKPYEKREYLVFVENSSKYGQSHHIVLEENTIFSMADVSGWSKQDWNDLPCNAIRVNGSDCTIRNNMVRNINFGIWVKGKNCLVEHNTVDSFAGDGLRGLGDYDVFQYNVVKNNYNVNDNHDDAFQSWSQVGSEVGAGKVVGVTVRGNTFINTEDPKQPFQGPLQGVGCFVGTFEDWVVENNVVITEARHGITMQGAKNCRIVNNTVINPHNDKTRPPWIEVAPHKNGTQSENCLIRNNLTAMIHIPQAQDLQEVHMDNNIIVQELSDHFVDAPGFNLKLIPTSSAIDVGSFDLAPLLDRDKVPRPQGKGIDIGAYEYYEGSPVYPDAGAGGSSGSSGSAGSAGSAGSGAEGGLGGESGSGGGMTDAGVDSSHQAGAGGKSQTPEDAAVDATNSSSDSAEGGGCGCRAVRNNASAAPLFVLPLAWFALRRRRRGLFSR